MGAMLLGRGKDVKEEQIPAAVKGSQVLFKVKME